MVIAIVIIYKNRKKTGFNNIYNYLCNKAILQLIYYAI